MLDSSQLRDATQRIQLELDNVRTAWAHAQTNRQIPWLNDALMGLMRFYQMSGLWQEGITVCRSALAQLVQTPSDSDARFESRLRFHLANFLSRLKQAGALDLALEALTKAEEVDDLALIAHCHNVIVNCYNTRGSWEKVNQHSAISERLSIQHGFFRCACNHAV